MTTRVGRVFRLLFIELGRELEHVVHQRVIGREQLDDAGAKAIAARVADVRQMHDGTLGLDGRRDDGRAHALVFVRSGGELDDLGVRLVNGGGESLGAHRKPEHVETGLGRVLGRLEMVTQRGQRHRAGNVAGILAACAVREGKEVQLSAEKDRVFVVLASPDVGVTVRDDANEGHRPDGTAAPPAIATVFWALVSVPFQGAGSSGASGTRLSS